jgi:hypothetical protein
VVLDVQLALKNALERILWAKAPFRVPLGNGAWIPEPREVEGTKSHERGERELGLVFSQGIQDLQVMSFAPETAISERQAKRLSLPCDLRFH